MVLNIGNAMESPLHRQVHFKAYCHMGLAFITCQLIQNGFEDPQLSPKGGYLAQDWLWL